MIWLWRAVHLIIIASFLMASTSCSSDKRHLKEMNGRTHSWPDLRGKWVFINYWASWCEPCLQEIAELNQFYAGSKNSKVALYAVNYDGLSSAEQQKLIAQLHLNYPSLKEDPKSMLQLGEIRGLPATFVFNPKGELVETLYGGQSVEDLKDIMKHS